jgi:flagellin-like hook-associated protein FlgL
MRIDSMTYFKSSLPGIQSNQSAISRLNQQISSGLTMLSTKDDPVTAAKAMELSNRIAVRTQYAANQDKAELDLNYETVVTKELSSALDQARALITSVTPSMSASLRNVHSEQLKGVFNHLLDLTNTRNPSGDFIFGGSATHVQPYVNTSTITVPASVNATTFDGVIPPGPLGPPEVLATTRNIDIGVNHRVQVNDNIAYVLSFTDAEAGSTIADPANPAFVPATDRHDLLQNLAHAIVNLPGNTLTDADLKSYMDLLDVAQSKLGLIQHRIAGSLTEIKDVRASTQALLLNEKNALSDMTQVDKAAAIVELQSRRTTLEAISRAYSLTSGLSLFNYLG